METHSTSSESARRTREISPRERKLIRDSRLSHAQLAKIFSITEAQVRYIRAKDSHDSAPARKAWSEEEEDALKEAHKHVGWKPAEIAPLFPEKTYTQVYRKMVREFKNK